MGLIEDLHVTTGSGLDEGFNPLPSGIVSPINVVRLGGVLGSHPNDDMVRYLISGFTHGFDIGFRGGFDDDNTRPRNLLSAIHDAAKVSAAVQKELTRGHTSGPFSSPPFLHTHCSPLGAAPKPDGSVRLILDLSSPRGLSVNDGISADMFACKYSKFDDAVDVVVRVGVGCFLAKIDIRHAFRLCPVRPDQWYLLCYRWCGGYFVDTRLPFGGRSSPFIFNTFAGALAWVFIFVGGIVFLVHYLDDFFFANSSLDLCQRDMARFVSISEYLGVPLAEDKLVGPVQCITYLGIEIDSVAMTIRLPEDKLANLRRLVQTWVHKNRVLKRDILSFIGVLAFASKVVKPGRMFLRRLIDLSTTVQSLHFYVTMNAEARADIMWWHRFLPTWNGVSIIQSGPVSSLELRLFTDASDMGFGGVYRDKWFFSGWRCGWGQLHINVRELFAVWAALRIWGLEWVDRQILIYTDNESITHVWRTGTCKDKVMMRIVRALFFYAACHNINVLMHHVRGSFNVEADLLSRLQVHRFRQSHPSADPFPSSIPTDVWDV